MAVNLLTPQSGGPSWTNLLGRRDGFNASRTTANAFLPGPFDTLPILRQSFTNVGLNDNVDLVALSGTFFLFARNIIKH